MRKYGIRQAEKSRFDSLLPIGSISEYTQMFPGIGAECSQQSTLL